jgi:hypothetical protein
MIYYLNKGLILEQVIVKALQDYFNTMGIPEFYKGVTVNITNKHPFAQLLLNAAKGAQFNSSLFPSIVVATESDGKPGELDNLVDANGFALEPSDFESPEIGGKSPLEAKDYMMMTPQKIEAIRAAVNEKGRVYGISYPIRRQDKIAIEIWAENIQLKNELYEYIRLFVCGFMKNSLEALYEENGLTIFDKTVRGQRSNNFNEDFGVVLAGALITFEADYIIEQSVIDTELVDGKIDFMEVINHVEGYTGTTRSVIWDDDAGSGLEGGNGSAEATGST